MKTLARLSILPPIAWFLFFIGVTVTGVAFVFLVLSFTTPAPSFGFRGIFAPVPLIFSVLGLMITRSYTKNTIGWLFLINGVLAAFLVFGDYYGAYALLTRPGTPGAAPIVWIQEWAWIPVFGITASVVPLLFPNGRLLSPPWWPAMLLTVATMLLATVAVALRPGPLESYSLVSNPFGIEAARGFLEPASEIMLGVFILIMFPAAWSLILRYRRTGEEERHQLKWVLAAGVLAVCSVVFGASDNPALQTVTILGIVSVPLATGLSVLKYRLYDIDIVINRSLVYVPLTAILAGIYIAGIGVLKALFTELTGLGSEAAIALTTLAVVALLTPLKNSLQSMVDTRFKEAPDAERALSKFDAQVRQVVNILIPDQIAQRFLTEAAAALQAESGGLYWIDNGTKSLAATYGEWAGPSDLRMPLEAGGRLVGELWLTGPKGLRPLTARERAGLERCATTVAEAKILAER